MRSINVSLKSAPVNQKTYKDNTQQIRREKQYAANQIYKERKSAW